MKTLGILTISLSGLLTACGGDSGGTLGQLLTPENDDVLVVPVIEGVPDGNRALLGELAELIGTLNIAYSFTGTDVIFGAVVRFTIVDLVAGSNENPILLSTAQTSLRQDVNSEPEDGPDVQFSCSYASQSENFLCISDANGPGQTFFRFPELVDGRTVGEFEFCADLDSNTCVSNLLISPDGTASMSVRSELAITAAEPLPLTTNADLEPYLRYFKQGTADAGGDVLVSGQRVDSMVSDAQDQIAAALQGLNQD